MGTVSFNVSLGREVELYNRVKSNDPANSALIMTVLASAGLETDAVLKDYATLDAILAASNNQVTNGGFGRKTLTDADLAAYSVDNANDRILLVLPVQTFAAIAAGDAWSKVLICYDNDTTAGTDANIVPISGHDLRISGSPVVPNGSNIVIDFSGGFAVAV